MKLNHLFSSFIQLPAILSFRKLLLKRKHELIIILLLIALVLLPNMTQKISVYLVGKSALVHTDSTNIKNVSHLKQEIAQLDRKLRQKIPSYFYLVVNSSENTFRLYKNTTLVREGICSTGSYIMLEGEGDQQWLFKTPKGEFRIQGKIESPVWRKPDWAFVEEGIPVPSGNHHSRYEFGVLGDYALSLGDGYLIHGTLYQRFLGLPVTHGCIRMRDDDLELVYRSLNVGSRVFIY